MHSAIWKMKPRITEEKMGNLLHSEGCLFLSNQSEPLPNPGIEVRRSSRIPLVIRIVVAGIHPETRLYFQAVGNTLVVNRHGALISTIPGLQSGMWLCITVATSGKSARARVVWDIPQSEGRYGIELETPENL
jgi:hypothetical protein